MVFCSCLALVFLPIAPYGAKNKPQSEFAIKNQQQSGKKFFFSALRWLLCWAIFHHHVFPAKNHAMKKVCLLLGLLTLTGITHAQLRFGIKAGLSTADLNTNDLNILGPGGTTRLRLAAEDASFGAHFGIVLQARLGAFLLQPELVFNSASADIVVDDLANPGNALGEAFKETYNNLDIPLLLGYRFGPLRLHAGPVGHVFLNSTSDLFEFSDYDQNFDDLTIGWQGGLGLDLWNLMIDLRFEGNFNKFGDHITFGGNSYAFDQSPSRWLLSAGWLFGRR